MRVVITGGSGYIGTRVCQLLAGDPDIEKIVAVDVAAGTDEIPKLKHVRHDITQPMDWLFAGADTAVHLAWVLNPIHDELRMTEVNLGGTRNFLRGCASAGVGRLVLASSATAYGAHRDNPVPIPETQLVDPMQPYQYAREKAIMEGMAHGYAQWHAGTELVIVRPAIVVGRHMKNFISRSMLHPVIQLIDGENPPMQFVHEEDVARAIYLLVKGGPAGTYNLGPGGALTVRELAARRRRPVVPIPIRAASAIASLAWRFGLTKVIEAPPSILDFLRYPWVVDGSKVESAIDFQYRYDTSAAFDEFRKSAEG